MSYNNLIKLANKRNEEKKPGMATYAPAALGALGAGGVGVKYMRQESSAKGALDDAANKLRAHDGQEDWWRNYARSPELDDYERHFTVPHLMHERRKEREGLAESVNAAQKKLDNITKGSYKKHLLGGGALLGLGVGATAFLRNRNKRKQER